MKNKANIKKAEPKVETIETQEQEVKEGFHIDTDEKANWLLRKLGNLEAESARVKAQADSILKGIEHEKERLIARFGVELESYCKAKLEGSKSKTAKFLQGSCSFRTVPGGLRLIDQDAAIGYAKQNYSEAIEVIEKLNGTLYREQAERALAETGEILPGLEVAPERETFAVKFPKLHSETAEG